MSCCNITFQASWGAIKDSLWAFSCNKLFVEAYSTWIVWDLGLMIGWPWQDIEIAVLFVNT